MLSIIVSVVLVSTVTLVQSQGEFPLMVAVMKVNLDGSQEFLDEGIIVDSRTILTKAHNVGNNDASTLVVKVSGWDATDPHEAIYHQTRSVSEMTLDAGCSDRGMTIVATAMLELKQPLTFTKNAHIVCLSSSELKFNLSECIATGWGGRANFEVSVNRQSVMNKEVMPMVDHSTCQDRLREDLGKSFNLDDSFVCAGGDKGVDTCKGDGVSPDVSDCLRQETVRASGSDVLGNSL